MSGTWSLASGQSDELNSIARFVDKGESGSFVDLVCQAAIEHFIKATDGRYASFAGALTAAGPELRLAMVGSVYAATRDQCQSSHIRYEFERDFDAFTGRQQVRKPADTAKDRDGTCIDLAILFAACLARVQLQPLLVVLIIPDIGTHALTLVRLQGNPEVEPLLELQQVFDQLDCGALVAVECTGLVSGYPDWPEGLDLAQALERGRSWLDVCQCRWLGWNLGPWSDFAQLGARARQALRSQSATSRPKHGGREFGFGVDVMSAWQEGFHPYTPNSPLTIREQLPLIDFSLDIEQGRERFVGRKNVPAAIDSWFADRMSPSIFLLTGEHGIGKTAIAADLCRKQHNKLVAVHFFHAGDARRADARQAVLSMTFQMSQPGKIPGYRRRLAEADLGRMLTRPLPELLHWVFVELFGTEQAHEANECPRLVVIDALDEAEAAGANALSDFIDRVRVGSITLPRSLKIFATSLPGHGSDFLLPEPGGYHLDAGHEDNLRAIRRYLDEAIRDKLSEADIGSLVERSGGSFLWASASVVDVLAGVEHSQLPRGLPAYYRYRLARLRASDPYRYDNVVRPLLEVLVAALGPLPLGVVAAATGVPSAELRVEAGRLSGHVEVTEAGLRARHMCFVEWLKDAGLAQEFVVRSIDGHARLAQGCWDAMNCDRPLSGVEADYCLANLPEHLLAAGRWQQLTEALWSPKLRVFERWVAGGRAATGIKVAEATARHLGEQHRGGVVGNALAIEIGKLYMSQGNYDDARQWLEEGARGSYGQVGRKLCAVALHELGSIALYNADHARASRLYGEALALVRDGPEVHHGEVAANLLGLATLSNGLESLALADDAVERARTGGDITHEVAAERMAAEACRYLDRLEDASLRVERALFICKNRDVASAEACRALLVAAHVRYAICLRDRAALKPAIDCYQAAFDRAAQSGLYFAQINARIGLGVCALSEGRTDDAAVNWFEPLKDVLAPGRHLDALAAIGLGLAGVRQQSGELDAAASAYQSVLSVCRRLPDWLAPWFNLAATGLGTVWWHTHRPRDAEECWREALASAQNAPYRLRMTTENIARGRRDAKATPR